MQARFVPDAEARLYDDMTWAGLRWDEGTNSAICENLDHGTHPHYLLASQYRPRQGGPTWSI